MKIEVTAKRRVARSLLLVSSFVFAAVILFGTALRVLALDALTPITRVTTGISYTGSNDLSFSADMSTDARYVVFSSDATNLIDGQPDTNGLRDIYRYDRQTGATVLVSTDSSGNASNGASEVPVVSANGRYVAFHSLATNLVAGDTNGVSDIFLKDLQTGTTTRVSTDSAGVGANGSSSFAEISDDGRYVAFQSGATNLVASDTNARWDVFVKDTQTGTTTRVSTTAANAQATSGNSSSRAEGVALSGDGRYVAFSSTATNLVAGDTNNREDVFVKDTQTSAIIRASTDSANAQVNNNSIGYVFVSDDGRYVAFRSDATNLVAGDTNAVVDVFWKDTQTGTTTRVTTDSSGAQVSSTPSPASLSLGISSNGRYVFFASNATSLVAGDTNSTADVFMKDTTTGVTSLISSSSAGTVGNSASSQTNGIGISADGRYVAFASFATNLVAGDINDECDIFVKDTQTAAVSLASPGTAQPEEANGAGYNLTVSADGRYVAYESWASNHVAGDTNNKSDIFLYDQQTGATTRVSTDSSGTEANNYSDNPSISADGRYVAFESGASNLVAGDTNGLTDAFLKDTQTGTITRISTDSSGTQGTGGFYVGAEPFISDDGRYIAFTSQATNLVVGDTNGTDDVYLKDTQTGTTTLVSTDSVGGLGNSSSIGSVLSDNARYVVFVSYATNLVANDTNGDADIFVKDTQTGTTTRVSTDALGNQANDGSFLALSDTRLRSVTSDGRYVTFYSGATNLVSGDTNSVNDIFVKDLQTGGIVRASTDENGVEGDGYTYDPSISDDGRYVTFWTDAGNLVDDDGDSNEDVFIKDLVTGDISRLSTKANGDALDSYSQISFISADGRYVAFWSFASDVVANDTNNDSDFFLRANPFATILEDFADDSLAAGSTTGSVLDSATQNGQPVSAANYILSLANNGGLSGATINADGTIVIPSSAVAGTYTLTYQACEAAAPTYCWTASAVLGVSTTSLAETGVRQIIPATAGLVLVVTAARVVTIRRHFRRHYRAR
jgi:Tol biopolymer transport system component